MTIKLYDLVGADETRPFSPHCWKVAMALRHKGQNFESVPTFFRDVQNIEGGCSKIVPIIRDGDTVISDSFKIALYLEDKYDDQPTLFGGEGGLALTRFFENWTNATMHPFIGMCAIKDIHDILDEGDKPYFKESREGRFGKSLEEIGLGREEKLDGFLKALHPLRMSVSKHNFIGGENPLFADYIAFGALQWARITCTMSLIPHDDPIHDWFERCLDLYEGLGRCVNAAVKNGE